MRQSIQAAATDRFAWQEGDPWSAWTGPFMTLHLYWASGEFICEDFVYMQMNVEDYTQYLEEGLILEEIKLEADYEGERESYRLVWKDVVLGDARKFWELEEDHGMSRTEPNDVIVCLASTQVHEFVPSLALQP